MKYLIEFEGKWNKIISKLKQKFSILTDDDLLLDDDQLLLEGKQYDMLERVQKKLGKSEDELYELISELLDQKTQMEIA